MFILQLQNRTVPTSLTSLSSFWYQKPFIFAGTIRDNILIGNPDASEQELIEAASWAGVFSFEEALDIASPQQTSNMTPSASRALRPRHNSCNATKPIAVTLTPRSNGTIKVHFRALDTGTNPHNIVTNRNEETQLPLNNPIAVRLISKGDHRQQEIAVSFALRKKKMRDISLAKKKKVLEMITAARGANLSGGFAQSVALARIFLRKNSKIVILDESMSAMDPIKKRAIIYPALLRFVKQHGMTLIMISHDMSCLDLVDNVIMLERGKVVCQGTHEQLLQQKDHKYMQMLGYDKKSRL